MSCVFDTYGCFFILFYFISTFVMTVFIRTFLFSSAGTPNAVSIIMSKGR